MKTLSAIGVLIVSIWFMQLAGGILSVVVPLGLNAKGVDPAGIGFIAALNAAGFMCGAWLSTSLIRRIGNIRCFSAASAAVLIGVLIIPLDDGLWVWGVGRFVHGLGFALMFASLEAWLGLATPSEQRGSMMGIYHLVAKAALMLGPFLILSYPIGTNQPFLFAGIFLGATVVVICLTRQGEPRPLKMSNANTKELFKQSPSAFVGAFAAGLINTGVLSLLPVYIAEFTEASSLASAAVFAVMIANLGGLVSQWPAGKLSDRMDRRTVVGLMASFAAIVSLLLAITASLIPDLARFALILLWGAGSLSFYGICMAHGVDRTQPEQVTLLMSRMLLSWATGSIIGPAVCGLVMQSPLGASGLFYLSTGLYVALAALMVIRRSARKAVPEEMQEDWQPVLPSAMTGTELDPRSTENMDDERADASGEKLAS